MRRFVILIVLLSSGLIAGCKALPSAMDNWIGRQGGVAIDHRQQRVDAVAARLRSNQRRNDPDITVGVLATDALCAYGWPTGKLFITRGLVDRLTDDELAAALAHEMGHLLSNGRLNTIASLRGSKNAAGTAETNLDIEAKADAIGVKLLQTHNIPARSMATMLTKVRDSGTLAATCRLALSHRIELIENNLDLP